MQHRTTVSGQRVLLLAMLLLLALIPNDPAFADPRCFAETGFCLDGRFRSYWEQNGALAIFGFPITAQGVEVTSGAHASIPIQWLERNRFELHPQNRAPYDVLLGRLGDDLLRQQGRDWQTFPKADPQSPHYTPETGHAITHPRFWQYWSTHGLDFGDPGISHRESLALFGFPISEAAMETNASGHTVLTQWFERARLEDHGDKGVLLGLLGHEMRHGQARDVPIPLPQVTVGLWISSQELARLPMKGTAWERLKATADGDLGTPTLADQDATHDVKTLAVGLVYVRTGETRYRQKAAEAIRAVIGTENGGGVLPLSRNLVSYVITADLIDLQNYDRGMDQAFRQWLGVLRTKEFADGTLLSEHEQRANNRSTMAGASRAAIAVYLNDTQELARTAQVFHGWLGNRSAYAGFAYINDLSWQADPAQPVAINPRGALKNGQSIDGAMPEEMRRGCGIQWPPCHTGYPWEALQGAYIQALILSRQGYDVWNWEDQALLRAVRYLKVIDEQYGGWWATGDDTYLPWIVNLVYKTDFPTRKANLGKNMGWTDWLYAR